MTNLSAQAVKSFFTTASTITLITGIPYIAAAAATRTTTGNNAVIGGANTNLDGAFVNGDDVKIGNAAHTAISTGATITFGPGGTGIDVDNNTGVAFTINHPVTFSQAADFGSANGGLASVTVNASGSIFQQGISGDLTVNSGNNITLGGAVLAGGGNAGNVSVTGATISGLTTVAGNLTVGPASTVNQDGAITGNLKVENTSGSPSKLTGTVNSNVGGTLTVTNGSGNTEVTVNDVAGDVSIDRGTLNMKAAGANVSVITATISGLTTVAGNLTVGPASTVNQDGAITGNLKVENTSGSPSKFTGTVNSNVGGTLTVTNSSGNTEVTVNNVAGDVSIDRGTLNMKAAGANVSVITATISGLTTVAGNLTVGPASTVNQDGAITGNLKVENTKSSPSKFTGTVNSNVGGTLTVTNSSGNTEVTVNDVAGDVSIDRGTLNMKAAGANVSVITARISGLTTVAGNLTVGPASTVNQDGAITGNLKVENTSGSPSKFTGTVNSNVGGTLTVTNSSGNTEVTVNDVAGDVSIDRGTLNMKAAGANVSVITAKINGLTTVAGNLTVDAATVTQGGAIGGNVSVTNATLNGDSTSSNITGTLTLSNHGGNNVTAGNVTGNVTVTNGDLSMRAAGGDINMSGGSITQGGTISGNVAITGGTFNGNDITNTDVNGTFNISNNATATVNKVSKAVTIATGGKLTIASALSNVNITGSTSTANLTSVGGNVSINDSTVAQNGTVIGNVTLTNNATLNGTANANIGGTLTLSTGDVATVNNVTGDVTVSSGGDLTIKAAVSDVNITGAASKVSLATIGGNLDITDGTINITGSVSGNVVVKNATLMGSKTDTNIDGTLQVGSTVVVNKVTGDITVTDGTLTMGAAASSLTADGAGTTVNVTSIGKNLNISNSATVNQGGAIGTDVTIATGGVLNGNTGTNTDIVGSLNMDNSAANKVVVNSVGVDVAMLGGTLEVVSIGGEVDMRGGTISKLNQVGGDFAPTAPSNAASKVIVDGVLTLQGGKYILPTNGVTEFATAASGLRFNGAAANIEIKTDIDVTAAAGSGSIFVGEDTSFTGRIGTAALPIGSITYDADKIFTYGSTTGKFDLHVAGDIAPPLVLGSGKGGFIARYDGTKEFDRDLGTDALNLKYVSFSPSTGGAASNAILKAGRKIYATELDLYPHEHTGIAVSDATLTVEGNTLIDALITTKANSNLGKVVFTANSTVRQDIGSKSTGRLNEVNFASANIADAIILSGNVYADNIIHKKADLRPTKDITFYGKYDGASSTYTMGLHRLTIAPKDGDPVGTDVGKLVSNAPVTYNFTATETAAGNIFISKGSFDMSNIDSLVINITDLTTTIPTGNIGTNGFACRELPIFHAGDDGSINLIVNNNVSFNIASSTNQFVQWSYSDGKILQKVLLGTGNAIVEAALAQAGDDSDTSGNINSIAASLSELTNDLIGAIQDGSTGDFVARLQADLTEVTEHAHSAFQGAMQTVSERISSVSLPGALGTVYNLADNSGDDYTLTGVSAGEDTVDDSAIGRKHGAWSSYSIYSAHQQGLDRRPGYRAISHSATIGGDTMPMEDVTVGASFTFSRTFIRHKDSNLGDRSNTDSYIGSVYAMKEFANHWFVQGVGMYSRTRVKNKEYRGSVSNREIARANFNANSFGGELLAGYNYLTQNQTLVVPMVGLEYQRLSKTSYQEYGTRNQNLSVRKSPDDKLDGVIGIRFARNYRAYGYDFTPEIHGYIRHDLLNDRINLEARLPALAEPLAARSTNEHNRTFYNIGGSVTSAIAGNVDMSLSYDAYLAKRHNARQASVKLRVSF